MTLNIDFDNACEIQEEKTTAFECRPNIGSFDPNDKRILLNGIESDKLIQPTDDIEYVIRFQNTGTDTALILELKTHYLLILIFLPLLRSALRTPIPGRLKTKTNCKF